MYVYIIKFTKLYCIIDSETFTISFKQYLMMSTFDNYYFLSKTSKVPNVI